MAGRRAISSKMIDNDTLHISNEDLEQRAEAEPIYDSQIFEVPKDFDASETKKWNELANLIRAIENHPLSDAHRDKMIQYCQVWVRRNVLIPINKENPTDKDIANLLAKYDVIIRGLGSDLCLDLISQAKIGKARSDFKKKKVDTVGDIRNRQGK